MSGKRTPLDRALIALSGRRDLDADLAAAAFNQLMQGDATPAATAGLLMGLRVKGEVAAELAGAVRALRAAMVKVELSDLGGVIDTCGTGGGSVGTFNISTVAAFVAVGAGARVAKHGNRSHTSQCGSADLLEALGIEITLAPDRVAQLIAEVGMAFLFAPAFHPAMRFVAPVRRELAIPTLMNMVGPLANPAGVRNQLIGVADSGRAQLIAHALAQLGTDHSLVVYGRAGMDEIAPLGITDVWEVRGGEVSVWELDPRSFGFDPVSETDLSGGTPQANARRARGLLGDPGSDPAGCTAVLLNAGASLYVSGIAGELQEGFTKAREALESGAALRALENLQRAAAVNTSE